MGASQGAAAGAPWWLTIALPMVTAVATHYLTLHRERQKSNREWHQRWYDDTKKLVAKISDAAIQHYVDSDSVNKTAVSASLLISDVKRLRSAVNESKCLIPSDSKITADALVALDSAITAPDDFQNCGRVARGAEDALCGEIRACEHLVLIALGKPRVRRT